MKKLFLLTFLFIWNHSFSQTTQDSVKAAVTKLFDGMKNADTVLLKSAFADSAILQTVGRNKEGKTIIRTEELKDFIDFVSKEKVGAADERIGAAGTGTLATNAADGVPTGAIGCTAASP